MFEHFGANSLSAFRRKFWAYELRPHVSTCAGGTGSLGVAGTAQVGPTGAPITPSQGASRPRWGVQQAGDETYVGELLDGRRHGTGIMLTKAQRSWVLHAGRFAEGKRNGPAVVATSRGERFEGFFRIRFRGMMNGQPAGKGCLEWSDGSTQAGQFDGCSCYLAMREQDVAGVLLVAADNAQKGRAAAAEAQAASARQQPDVAQRAVQLFASLEPARGGCRRARAGSHASEDPW